MLDSQSMIFPPSLVKTKIEFFVRSLNSILNKTIKVEAKTERKKQNTEQEKIGLR